MGKIWVAQRVTRSLLLLGALGATLFVFEAVHYNNTQYWFLIWNLFLAWLPLFFAWHLHKWLKSKPWASWQGIGLTLLWLGFLPNSFYISSDLIHLRGLPTDNVLYDAVMLLLFAINGYLLGYISLFLVHKQLLKKLPAQSAHAVIAAVLLLCSFAIYLGRYLRWNTWDVLINPAGLLFDVSERIINPVAHPQTFSTTITFFALLGTLYIVIWEFVQVIKNEKA
jgi:uncharacterized membrane protein